METPLVTDPSGEDPSVEDQPLEGGVELATGERADKIWHAGYPECLRPEIERLAAVIYERRLADGRDPDPFGDWLEAEAIVKHSHEASPARLLPGGDLFPYQLAPNEDEA